MDREKLVTELIGLADKLNVYRTKPEIRAAMDAEIAEEFEGINTEEFCLLRIEGITHVVNRMGHELDNCQICKGQRGGERGNENIVDGIVMCDYCSVSVNGFKEVYDMTPKVKA